MFAAALIGQRAENRQQKNGQNIVQGHDHAGPGLGHTEFIGQDQGNGGVVGLPEGTDQEESEAYQDRALIVELHIEVLQSYCCQIIIHNKFSLVHCFRKMEKG